MDKLQLKALGKINLGLDVLGKRENGYHDVRMVMQTLYLYDTVTLIKEEKEGIEIESNLFFLPKDENNIAWSAVLYYAGNCSGRRNRGNLITASTNAEMPDSACEAANQCVNKNNLSGIRFQRNQRTP